jgi:hypothetical protein
LLLHGQRELPPHCCTAYGSVKAKFAVISLDEIVLKLFLKKLLAPAIA